jgi:hypothetical protein
MIAILADDQAATTDTRVTLYVHAGIAASDVICCVRLGEYSAGEDHNEALSLLNGADISAVRHLRVLLTLKTKASYSHTPITKDEAKGAGRAADALVEAARLAFATIGGPPP